MSGLLLGLLQLRDTLEERYSRLSSQAKLGLWIWAGLQMVFLGFLVVVGPERLFRILSDWANDLREAPLGWLVLLAATVVTSIPPLMGYSTCVTLCGFAFGLSGWLIATAGAMLGAATAFILCRRLIHRYLPYLEQEPAFRGLGAAVRLKGLKLIILIRLCPFPFGYSNAFFSSIETVSLPQFLLATLAITPKLLLHVWIGERMYLLADPDTRRQMDPTAKLVNFLSIVLGSLLGVFTSWYIYRLVKQETDHSVMLPHDLADEAQLLDRLEGANEDEEGDDVDAIERRLVEEGHISRDQINGVGGEHVRQSTDRWDDNFSDFGDDEPPRDLRTPQINISAPTPIAEEPDPLTVGKLK